MVAAFRSLVRSNTQFRLRLLCSAIIALAALPSQATSETRGDLTKTPDQDPTPVETPVSNSPVEDLGLGPFKLNIAASANEMFSDNIFVTKNNKESDWIMSFSPVVTAAMGKPRNDLNLRAGAEIGRYARSTSENYDDFFAAGDGRLTLGPKTSLLGGVQYDWTHESRESPDAVNGLEPTRYETGDYYIGLVQSLGKFVVRAGGTVNTYAYDDVRSSLGLIDNADRDRTEYEAGARVSYRSSSNVQPFAQAYWVIRDYDSALDDFGYRRSSTGFRVAAGLSVKLTAALDGEIYGGAFAQDYDDARFSEVTEPDFGARLNWRPAPGTQLRVSLDRSIEETTLPGSPGYLRTAAGATVEQMVRPDLSLSGHFYYSANEYLEINRIDYVSDAGLSAKYYFLPRFYVGTGYTFLHRISNAASADFNENRVWIRLGAQLAPAYSSGFKKFTQPNEDSSLSGFFVGLLAGNGTLTTALDGPPGAGGSLTADFGNNGWQGDVVAGYGVVIRRIYLGLEAGAAMGSQHWLYNGTGGTRIYGVRKLDSYELAARFGYELDNNILLYGRFGGVAAQFATPYQQNMHYVRPAGYQRGLRIGGGVEFPLWRNLFGRVEYTHTSYADYDVMPAQTADNFANDENLVRFGAIYHLGAATKAAPPAKADFGGLYAGLQAGFGTLISRNAGDRNPPQTLTAQRAGSGATGGLFGGYGVTVGNVYLGAEIEAEFSNADWNIERDPTGRIYSVAKDYTLGASLRAGYIFESNTLVYGRVGIAETRFKNKYNDEHGINYVTPDVDRAGLRLGGGVEMPLKKTWHMRFDYTWTRYASYNVNYVTGVDFFRNSESLLRIGIVKRF